LNVVGTHGTTRMDGVWRLFSIEAFRSKGVNDSMNLELSREPTFNGLKFGMSSTSFDTRAVAAALLLAIKTSRFSIESQLFRYAAGTV